MAATVVGVSQRRRQAIGSTTIWLGKAKVKIRRDLQILGGVRLALLAGFGGLLALLVFLGYSSVDVLRRVDKADSESTRLFVVRDDTLEALRGSAYNTTSTVRDYLLDPDAAAVDAHRTRCIERWRKTQEALDKYRGLGGAAPPSLVNRLESELAEYWSIVAPSLEWSEAQRRKEGYGLLSERLGPGRDQFLSTLDEIRLRDQQDHRQSIIRSSQLIDSLQKQLVVTIAVTLLLGFVLAGVSFYHLIRLENTAKERYQALLSANAELELLSQRVLQVQEEERRSIARDLHDEVGQSLGALLVDVGQVRSEWPDAPAPAATHLTSVTGLAEKTLAAIRNICLLLRPSMLDDLGLIPALHWQARETNRRHGIQVDLLADDADLELPEPARTAVYRIVQEALQNAIRHASAKKVTIVVRREERRLLIVIQDDGKGFDPKVKRGLGLLGIQERVSHLNGTFRVESALGRGAILQIELPMSAPDSRLTEVKA
jgi:signal transduction histidine kinase